MSALIPVVVVVAAVALWRAWPRRARPTSSADLRKAFSEAQARRGGFDG